MPLAHDAMLTKAEQKSLTDELAAATVLRDALADATDALDVFIASCAPATKGLMVDLYGDGKTKAASSCARPGGRRPFAFSAKLAEEREEIAAAKPLAKPPASVATLGDKSQAVSLHAARQSAQVAYSAAGAAFNDSLNRIMRRPWCAKDSCVDVFGDGLIKPVVDCTWPAPIAVYRGKLVA